ncbi:GntR family transcriptional regulator, partial [Pseudomonas aeruginosa]|uniref:GntR family transcriptional regulator n=1 Tax=Pseudomonas aeruginosa TaxID=287 RepID=UPI0039685E72
MTNLLLYQRIAQQLAEDIRRGVYQPGERVPSVRKLSTQLNVSHATVLQAYATLEAGAAIGFADGVRQLPAQ